MKSLKLCLIGHARHGKDTVAEMLYKKYGWTYKSSSMAAAEIFIYDALKEKYGYKSFGECYEDRINHREEWYNLICDYNSKDPARLAKEIMKTSNIYVGMRSAKEIEACMEQGVFDHVVWVRDDRKPLEDASSIDYNIFRFISYIVYNSGTLEDLEEEVELFNDFLELAGE